MPIALDITDPERVIQVAAECEDVSLLVNNAGVMKASTFTSAPSLDAAKLEMDTNYFGTLSMCRAFASILAASGGGALVNMLSVTSFYTNPLDASYGASKAAEWSLTNGVRIELAHQETLVVAVLASFIDTDMAAGTIEPKISPQSVARQAFDAVEAGRIEVLADERSRFVKTASFQLVRTLIEHDLIDEMRLMVYPVVLGAGERLFGETSDKKSMRLVKSETVGDLAHLICESVGE